MEPGYEKVNQDYICIQPIVTGADASNQSYMFAVLDGHGVEGVLTSPADVSVDTAPLLHLPLISLHDLAGGDAIVGLMSCVAATTGRGRTPSL